MSDDPPPPITSTSTKIIVKIIVEVAAIATSLWFCKHMVEKMSAGLDPREEKVAKEKSKKIAERLNRKIPATNHYEDLIMQDITFPEEISTTFNDIGGMKKMKDEIYEMVILPLVHPEIFTSINKNNTKSNLVTCPKGVLFYGPPGTGKTMMAKVIAKESNATFINVRLSTLQNKWFGESNKLVNAVFSVAKKLQPSIIFLDEIDLILRERNGTSDHEATGAIKATFMSLWDGLTTDENSQLTVLGATNRPFDVDKAVLRRLPRTFLFDLPLEDERTKIIEVILSNHRLASDFNSRILAEKTKGYSGSDLKELIKYASMIPIREVIKARCGSNMEQMNQLRDKDAKLQTRPLSMVDLLEALSHVQPTAAASYQYQEQFHQNTKPFEPTANADMDRFLASFFSIMSKATSKGR